MSHRQCPDGQRRTDDERYSCCLTFPYIVLLYLYRTLITTITTTQHIDAQQSAVCGASVYTKYASLFISLHILYYWALARWARYV